MLTSSYAVDYTLGVAIGTIGFTLSYIGMCQFIGVWPKTTKKKCRKPKRTSWVDELLDIAIVGGGVQLMQLSTLVMANAHGVKELV